MQPETKEAARKRARELIAALRAPVECQSAAEMLIAARADEALRAKLRRMLALRHSLPSFAEDCVARRAERRALLHRLIATPRPASLIERAYQRHHVAELAVLDQCGAASC